MHNMVWYVCGQRVQSLRTAIGTTCQYSSTTWLQSVALAQSLCVHHQLIRSLLPTLPLPSSTRKIALYDLLIPSYAHFPQPLLLLQPNKI